MVDGKSVKSFNCKTLRDEITWDTWEQMGGMISEWFLKYISCEDVDRIYVGSGYGPVAGPSGHSNETTSCINCWEFLGCLSDCYRLRKNSAPYT